MSDLLSEFDGWLHVSGPAALVIREFLIPVEGRDGVLFPPTFAASQDGSFKGGYNIDRFPDGKNICLIDSVGSQANRIEPMFATPGYRGLVPQIVVVAGGRRINLLDAGHRAGDAIVRCSALQQELQDAFLAVRAGNAGPLARIAPTSLVFGAWDSRDTQAKLPRLIASTIRAHDVRALTRSAQYVPATDYVENGLLDEPTDKKTKDGYAERGFVHVPASASPGGIIADGGIRRDAALHLAALRTWSTDGDAQTIRTFRRYVLGLALTAFTGPSAGYLRQGCNLVLDPDRPREVVAVHADGRREPLDLAHEHAVRYAEAAAQAFGLDPHRTIDPKTLPDREVPFDSELAKKDVAGDSESGQKKSKRAATRKHT